MDGTGLIILIVLLGVAFLAVRSLMTKVKRDRLMAKYGDEQIVNDLMARRFWQGMTDEMLVDSLGPPVDVGTRVLKAKTVHTYKYNRTGHNRFGTRIRLENGIVVGWEQK